MNALDFRPRDSGAPDKIIPRFSTRPIQNNFLSEQRGAPFFEDRDFVEMIAPGMARSIPIEEVTDEHKKRWPREYAAFKENREVAAEGVPLEEWTAITASVAMNLRAIHIRTVEELSQVDDRVLNDMGTGGRELRAKAQAYLARAKDEAAPAAMAGDLLRMKDENELLKQQIADLASRLEAQEKKRGPGRPPRQPEADED